MFRYILPFMLLLLVGCSAKKADIDYDVDFKTTPLTSFAIADDGKSHKTIDDERIKKAIIDEMQLKGYTHTEKNRADFYIAFESSIQKDVPSDVGLGLGLGTFSSGLGFSMGTARTMSKDEGSLLIYIVNPSTQKRLWQSSLTQNIGDLKSPKERDEYFNKSILIMLQEFPAKL